MSITGYTSSWKSGRAGAVDGVRGRICRLSEAVAQPCGQVPAGGEADHADAPWIQLPFAGAGTDQAQRALRIGQRRIAVVTALARQAVAQHEQGDATLLDEGRHQRRALLVQHHALVAAAGCHQQRGAVGAGRPVHDQIGRADVGDVAVRQRRIGAALDDAGGLRQRFVSRCQSSRPQRDPLCRSRCRFAVRGGARDSGGNPVGQNKSHE